MKTKQSLFVLLLLIIVINCSAQTNDKRFGLDFYPLPMLLGEIGAEAIMPIGKAAIGVNAVYYNPDLLLSRVLIRADLGSGDELDINVNAFIPGVSFTHYSKGGAKGFYVGGSVLYKISLGTVLLKDKYSGGTAYRGIVEADIDIKSLDIGARTGYRFVFNSGFSLRLGARLGYQSSLNDEVTYTIIEDYDGDGYDVQEDLEEGIERYTKKFTRPVTFQIEIGLGFTL